MLSARSYISVLCGCGGSQDAVGIHARLDEPFRSSPTEPRKHNAALSALRHHQHMLRHACCTSGAPFHHGSIEAPRALGRSASTTVVRTTIE